MRPWKQVPNIQQYYTRLARQVWQDLVTVGASQVIGALAAVAILALQIFNGVIPPNLTWANVHSVLWPYVALFAILIGWVVVRAPVKMDNHRSRRAALLREGAARRVAAVKATLEAASQARLKPQRTPAAEHHYQEAEREINGLTDIAKRVLMHIYTHEQLRAGNDLKVPGLDTDSILQSVNGDLANLRIIRQREEWTQGGRIHSIWWEITPGYKEALGEILYRPVTPPQA